MFLPTQIGQHFPGRVIVRPDFSGLGQLSLGQTIELQVFVPVCIKQKSKQSLIGGIFSRWDIALNRCFYDHYYCFIVTATIR